MNQLGEKIRVLAFEGWPTLLAGGQERSLFEVLSALRLGGAHVSLAYERSGELLAAYNSIGISSFKILTRNVVLKSIRAPINILEFVFSVARIISRGYISRNKWNIIYVNQYFDVTLAAVCGLILGIPVVCHLRLAAPSYLSRQFRWGLKSCKFIICNSEFTAKTYIDFGIPKEKISVVLNAIDTDVFSPPNAPSTEAMLLKKTRQVLYVGRICPEKGVEILIEAVARARERDSRIKLLIVGNPHPVGAVTASYLAQVTKMAAELLGAAVEFRSATPNVLELYRDSDLTVLPSVWDEPFGRVVIESMSCGTPCLASRVGGIPEIMSDHDGLMFERGAVDELANKLVSLVNWRTDDPGLGTDCRELVLCKFASERMNSQISELFRRHIATTPTPETSEGI